MAGTRGGRGGRANSSNSSQSTTTGSENPPANPHANPLANPTINPPFNPFGYPSPGTFNRQTQRNEDEPVQPALDANESLEIRRLVNARLELLTESSKYNLWYVRLLNTMTEYKLQKHIIERVTPVPGDEDS